ncbi:MAG: LysR family transcriptional regulator, partial [Lachnospiraceae bacterium]|nr:LysR family transcriptional regulator [Lachnospiraceae bacterium]
MYHPQLSIFVTVIDCGSFTKAAEVLYLSSTAVMNQMNAMEKRYSVKLLERTKHGVHPTAAGEIIYNEAKYMF